MGELKLNIDGVNSGKLSPHTGHAFCSERSHSSPFPRSMMTMPSLTRSAVSIESVRRVVKEEGVDGEGVDEEGVDEEGVDEE